MQSHVDASCLLGSRGASKSNRCVWHIKLPHLTLLAVKASRWGIRNSFQNIGLLSVTGSLTDIMVDSSSDAQSNDHGAVRRNRLNAA